MWQALPLVLTPLVLSLVSGVANANTSSMIASESLGGGGGVEVQPPPATRLSVGHVRGGSVRQMQVAVVNAEDGPHLRWTLEVSTSARTPTHVLVPLGITRDVAVRGFNVEITNQPWFEAVAVSRGAARLVYDELTREPEVWKPEQFEDPALLEVMSTDGKTDQLQLKVFPIARDAPGTVVIDMAILGGNELIVEPGPNAIALAIEDGADRASWKVSKSARSWQVRATRNDGGALEPVLTRAVSLIAGPSISSDQGPSRIEWREASVPLVSLSERVTSPRERRTK